MSQTISQAINSVTGQTTTSSAPAGPKYVVFNYVTLKPISTDTAPNYGDPNTDIQSQVMSAYSGGAGGTSLSSATTTPETTPSTLADPAAAVVSAASAAGLSDTQMTQINSSVGGLAQVGQMPNMISSMAAHATNVLDAPTKIFDAINDTFKPEEVGNPDRCNSLSGFIGSIQGAYNGVLGAITTGLNSLTNLLVAIPQAIIGAFTAASQLLLKAISSGVSSVIDAAISGLNTVSGGLFGALGSAGTSLINSISNGVQLVSSAIQAEISNVFNAVNSILTSPFRLLVPNVNPCIKKILEDANPSSAISSTSTDVAANTTTQPALPADLSFSERLFVQFGIAGGGGAQVIAEQQARADALGISRQDLAAAESRAFAAGR